MHLSFKMYVSIHAADSVVETDLMRVKRVKLSLVHTTWTESLVENVIPSSLEKEIHQSIKQGARKRPYLA